VVSAILMMDERQFDPDLIWPVAMRPNELVVEMSSLKII